MNLGNISSITFAGKHNIKETKIWYRRPFLWKPMKINGKTVWLRRVIQKIERSSTRTEIAEAYMDKVLGYYLTEEEAFLEEL